MSPEDRSDDEVEVAGDSQQDADGVKAGGSSSKDANSEGEDGDKGGGGRRRASTRIAQKMARRDIAAQLANSPPPPSALKRGKGRPSAATPSGDTSSSRGGTPAPLSDLRDLNKLAEIASKAGKARAGKGTAARSAISAPTTREMMAGIEATGTADVIDVLVSKPEDMVSGYKQLENWIYGGLDMYRHEFYPLLFPVFCHFYLDLVQQGYSETAQALFRDHSAPLIERHADAMHELSSLLLPQHVTMSTYAQRIRSGKYVIRMSRSGFALFVGWLTEGQGAEPMGAGEGVINGPEGQGRKSRFTVLKIVHGSLKFNVTSANTSTMSSASWNEGTGLISSLLPASNTATRTVNGKEITGSTLSSTAAGDPAAFNLQQGDLKLGPAPLRDNIREDAELQLREEDHGTSAGPNSMVIDGGNGTLTNGAPSDTRPSAESNSGVAGSGAPSALDLSSLNGTHGLVPPLISELLPQSPVYHSVDLKREIERVRDARKRIKLDPSLLYDGGSSAYPLTNGYGAQGAIAPLPSTGLGASRIPVAALPSICAYTFHDVADGINCSSFSEDSTLMAAGFAESYIRIWNLKKEKLKGLRSDISPHISDVVSLKKAREKGGTSTRKLIGHSGPVFATSFDPVGGTAAPPKFLLSASADHTTRLWSLDTLTNVVAYRGHKNPVWDVQWSPMGTYFATASRDRTARLWSTERINALRVFAGHLSDVDCLRFHPNSLYLATGSSDTTCRLWDVQRGLCMRVFIAHSGPITSLATSPDGRYLASASTDLTINLWDLGSGRKIKTMIGHTAPINSLSFSACTTMLVSGSSDWTVRCWDVKAAGGVPLKPSRLGGALPEHGMDETRVETTDLLRSFPTKRTPIINVQITPRNLCLVAGTFIPRDPS